MRHFFNILFLTVGFCGVFTVILKKCAQGFLAPIDQQFPGGSIYLTCIHHFGQFTHTLGVCNILTALLKECAKGFLVPINQQFSCQGILCMHQFFEYFSSIRYISYTISWRFGLFHSLFKNKPILRLRDSYLGTQTLLCSGIYDNTICPSHQSVNSFNNV